jgi:hypothetical protein
MIQLEEAEVRIMIADGVHPRYTAFPIPFSAYLYFLRYLLYFRIFHYIQDI